MKTTAIAVSMFFALPVAAFAQSNSYDHYTSGYTNSQGTYVEPHYQTNPNSSTYDNYGTRGNYNPHNGEYGARNPY